MRNVALLVIWPKEGTGFVRILIMQSFGPKSDYKVHVYNTYFRNTMNVYKGDIKCQLIK